MCYLKCTHHPYARTVLCPDCRKFICQECAKSHNTAYRPNLYVVAKSGCIKKDTESQIKIRRALRDAHYIYHRQYQFRYY